MSKGQINTITAVERQKKNPNRYNVYLNHQYAFSVHEDVLVKYRLLKGNSLDGQQVMHLLKEEEMHAAYAKALHFLSYRQRTEKEITDKLLREGIDASFVEEVIQKLHSEGYLNDQLFAKQFASDQIRLGKKGTKWISYELQKKGVSEHHIAEAIASISDEEAEHALKISALKKWNQLASKPYLERMRKTTGYLLRRGFTRAEVQRILKEIVVEEEQR